MELENSFVQDFQENIRLFWLKSLTYQFLGKESLLIALLLQVQGAVPFKVLFIFFYLFVSTLFKFNN